MDFFAAMVEGVLLVLMVEWCYLLWNVTRKWLEDWDL